MDIYIYTKHSYICVSSRLGGSQIDSAPCAHGVRLRSISRVRALQTPIESVTSAAQVLPPRYVLWSPHVLTLATESPPYI